VRERQQDKNLHFTEN